MQVLVDATAHHLAGLVRPDGPHGATRLSGHEIASIFLLLDEQQQEKILENFPSRLTSPSLTGPLETILDRPRLSAPMLRISALPVLLTVNPQEGRTRILAEIRQPHADSLVNARFLVQSLSRLPDDTLPELTDTAINHQTPSSADN